MTDESRPTPPEDEAAHLAAISRFFAERIPLHAWLGITVQETEPGRALTHMPFRPELVGDTSRPALHGGVLSLLADGTAGAALATLGSYGDRMSTIDLRIDYLRPASPADVWAEAQVVRMGGRVGVARVVISQLDEDGQRQEVANCTTVYSVRRRGDT